MSQREKLIERVRENRKNVRFDDACKIAEWLGFSVRKTKGSHHVFARSGERTQLNFQNRGGKIPPYQAQQLIDMVDKYEDEM